MSLEQRRSQEIQETQKYQEYQEYQETLITEREQPSDIQSERLGYSESLEYKDDSVLLEAYCSFPKSSDFLNLHAKSPTLLLFPAWSGRDEWICRKADSIARLGYTAIAMDVYGKGMIGQSKEENSRLMKPFIEDRSKLRKRLKAGWDAIRKIPAVDSQKIAAVGFCFGGLCALDLARSGVELKGVVSFHGLLGAPKNLDREKIRAEILALHGHDDPMVSPEDVLAFETEMTECQVDWQFHSFGHTMHAFTHPAANDASFGTVYQEISDRRSWILMRSFFEELFLDRHSKTGDQNKIR